MEKLGMLLLVLAVCVAAEATVVSDGSVFADEFNGASLDATKWAMFTENDYSLSVSGGALHLATYGYVRDTDPYGDCWINSSPAGMLNYGSLTEQATEIRFMVSTTYGPLNYVDSYTREVHLLMGRTADNSSYMDYAISLLRGSTQDTFSLGWGSYMSNPNPPQLLDAGAVDLARDVWHTLVLHHRSDNEMAFYLDGVALGLRSVPAGFAQALYIGDGAGAVGVTMDVDYVRVGAVVPEPSMFSLLLAGTLLLKRR